MKYLREADISMAAITNTQTKTIYIYEQHPKEEGRYFLLRVELFLFRCGKTYDISDS